MKRLIAVRLPNLPYNPGEQSFRIGEARMPIAAVIAGLRGADADPAALADRKPDHSGSADRAGHGVQCGHCGG